MSISPIDQFPLAKPPLILKLDEPGGGITYIGEAPTGTLDSEPQWRIRKMTETATLLTIKWAGGDKQFSWSWDDRTSLEYS